MTVCKTENPHPFFHKKREKKDGHPATVESHPSVNEGWGHGLQNRAAYFRRGMSARSLSSRRKSPTQASTPRMVVMMNAGLPTRTLVAVAPPR